MDFLKLGTFSIFLMASFLGGAWAYAQASFSKMGFAVALYCIISLGLIIRVRPIQQIQKKLTQSGFLEKLCVLFKPVFTWKNLAIVGVFLIIVGQVLILGADHFAKQHALKLELIAVWGLGLTWASLLMLAPYFLGVVKCIRLTPRVMKWFFITLILGGFLSWVSFFIIATTMDYEGHRMFCLFDDAMISLRYALNLTEGHGLVWNIGERVEGYTNLLMVLVMSVGTYLFSPNGAVLYTHITGIIFLLVIAFCLRAIAAIIFRDGDETRRGIYEALAFFLPLAYYPLVYWSVMGMETGLLSMLMTAATLMVIRPVSKARVNPWFSLLLGLMVLVRPDASVQAGLLLLFRLITLLPHRGALLVVIAEGLLFCVLPIVQMLFRHHYYQEWLPNTYTLKMIGLDTKIRILGGWGFMKLFLQSIWPALLLGGVGVIWTFKKEKALMILLLLSVMSYQVYVGGDPWPYWRIMAPYVPMLLLLNLSALESFFNWIISIKWQSSTSFYRSGTILVFVLTLLFGVIAWADFKFGKEICFVEKPFSAQFNASHVRIGLNLKKVCKPAATVGVFWAGTIPYYSGLVGIDFLGKCDKTVAKFEPDARFGGHGMISIPGHNKYDLAYSIRELKPDYIQNYYWAGSDETVYAQEHYTIKNNMWLKKGSENIYWDRLPQD